MLTSPSPPKSLKRLTPPSTNPTRRHTLSRTETSNNLYTDAHRGTHNRTTVRRVSNPSSPDTHTNVLHTHTHALNTHTHAPNTHTNVLHTHTHALNTHTHAPNTHTNVIRASSPSTSHTHTGIDTYTQVSVHTHTPIPAHTPTPIPTLVSVLAPDYTHKPVALYNSNSEHTPVYMQPIEQFTGDGETGMCDHTHTPKIYEPNDTQTNFEIANTCTCKGNTHINTQCCRHRSTNTQQIDTKVKQGISPELSESHLYGHEKHEPTDVQDSRFKRIRKSSKYVICWSCQRKTQILNFCGHCGNFLFSRSEKPDDGVSTLRIVPH